MNRTPRELILPGLGLIKSCDFGSCEHDLALIAVKRAMGLLKLGQVEQLRQLIKDGPIWDGDVICKGARDDLIIWGLAVRVCSKGEQGFTAATYLGWAVFFSDTDEI